MTSDFTSSIMPLGDVLVQGGSLVDLTGSSSLASIVGNNEPERSMKYSPAFSPFSFNYPPNPSGGSGRNIIIAKTDYAGLPHGLFFPKDDNTWISTNYIESRIDYGIQYTSSVPTDHKLNIYDETEQIVATANIGCIPSQSMIQCSSAVENGGITTSSGLTKWVFLGTGTGSVSFGYNSIVGNCKFIVQYDGVDVIDLNGSGSSSFNKTTSNKFAKVIVYSLTESAKWDFNLGCPGSISPPFTPPTGRTTFNATLTTYGLTLTGGVNIPIVCTYENSASEKRCNAIFSYDTQSNTEFSSTIELVSDGFSRYYDDTNCNRSIQLDQSGCNFIDFSGIIAVKEMPDLGFDFSPCDPSGTYSSTAYGAEKYGNGNPFTIEIKMKDVTSLDLVHYFVIYYSAGAYVGFDGPISSPMLPANDENKKHYVVASFDSTQNSIQPLSQGNVQNVDNVQVNLIEVSLCYNNVEKIGRIPFSEN
jgi:hypothetical protein